MDAPAGGIGGRVSGPGDFVGLRERNGFVNHFCCEHGYQLRRHAAESTPLLSRTSSCHVSRQYSHSLGKPPARSSPTQRTQINYLRRLDVFISSDHIKKNYDDSQNNATDRLHPEHSQSLQNNNILGQTPQSTSLKVRNMPPRYLDH